MFPCLHSTLQRDLVYGAVQYGGLHTKDLFLPLPLPHIVSKRELLSTSLLSHAHPDRHTDADLHRSQYTIMRKDDNDEGAAKVRT